MFEASTENQCNIVVNFFNNFSYIFFKFAQIKIENLASNRSESELQSVTVERTYLMFFFHTRLQENKNICYHSNPVLKQNNKPYLVDMNKKKNTT